MAVVCEFIVLALARVKGSPSFTSLPSGVAINTATDLSNFMDAHHPGDTITLNWVDREGNPRSAPIVLGSGPVGCHTFTAKITESRRGLSSSTASSGVFE